MTQNFRVCAICCGPEIYNDVISGLAVDSVGFDVPIKFGNSTSNGFRDIRGADFVSNEHKLAYTIPVARNAIAFRLKITQFHIEVRKNQR